MLHAPDELNHHVSSPSYDFVILYHQASPRGGTLYLELDDANRRVKIQGETVTVVAGTVLA
jgi:predicted PhzF superfamily epimerase YddE/YHI9